jgi:hypothetical protein
VQRRLVALLLVFLSLWQVASAAGLAQAYLAQDAELVHLALHWQAEGHHHGSDGSIQADDSHDSVQHVMADCSMHHLGLIVASPLAALEPAAQPVFQAVQPQPPFPYLDGLRRPPKSLS